MVDLQKCLSDWKSEIVDCVKKYVFENDTAKLRKEMEADIRRISKPYFKTESVIFDSTELPKYTIKYTGWYDKIKIQIPIIITATPVDLDEVLKDEK